MFWGCFAGDQVGDLFQIEGIMRKEHYHSILIRHAMPSGRRILGQDWIFQEDNDPKHSSKLCKDYIARKTQEGGMKKMVWPPQSPDLSPIELLWEEMDRAVVEKKNSSEEQLVKVVQEAWKEIGAEAILYEKTHKSNALNMPSSS